jgi:hypothetical protein
MVAGGSEQVVHGKSGRKQEREAMAMVRKRNGRGSPLQ